MRNVWNRDPYRWYKYKKDWKAIIGQFRLDLRCCRQRITKGYCEKDLWSIRDWFLDVVPDMLEEYKKSRNGSPGILGENYQNEEGFLVNDTCHGEWDRILDEMIFLFREADERQCRCKNPYEEEHSKAFSLFMDKYGLLGEKLRTPEERKRDSEQNVITYHGMRELPEYKELCKRYDEEEKKLEQYREECKNEAFELFTKWFYSLWD